MAFLDPVHGYGLFQVGPACSVAVGRTSDGGATFGPLVPVTTALCGWGGPASSITFSDRGDGFVYGPDLFASHDAGATWQAVPEPGSVLAVVPLGSSVWMVAAECPQPTTTGPGPPCPLSVAQSTDGGRHWQPARAEPPVAVASGSTVTEPAAGQTWLVRTGPAAAYVVGPPAAPGPSGGPNGAPLAWTGDGGATWASGTVPCAIPALSVVLSVAPDGALMAVCAGQGSAGFQAKSVSVSTDGGRTWAERGPCQAGTDCAPSPLTAGYLGTVDALSASKSFVIGLRGELDETVDGGRSWTGRTEPGATDGAAAQVVFFDAGHGLVLGNADPATARTAIWHTSDGGTTWTAVVPAVASSGGAVRAGGGSP